MGMYNYREAEEMYRKVVGRSKSKGYKVEDYFGRCTVMYPPHLLFFTVEDKNGELILYLNDYFNYNVLCYAKWGKGKRYGKTDYFNLIPVRLVILNARKKRIMRNRDGNI